MQYAYGLIKNHAVASPEYGPREKSQQEYIHRNVVLGLLAAHRIKVHSSVTVDVSATRS